MTPNDTSVDLSRRATVLLVISLGVVVLDQITKAIVSSRLALGESVEVISGLLHLTLVRNTGMAFGLLSRSDLPYKSVIMTLLSVGALAAVLYYTMRSDQGDRITRFGLAFILGGALGNIIDRVRFGYVVDFVDVFYGSSHWPAFNVADTSICIGVGLLLLDSFRRRESPSSEKEEAEATT